MTLPTVIPGTTFCGVRMSQTWEDVQLYEKVLNAHPDLSCIIELGTEQGGFSLYLQTQAIQRKMIFYTFDIIIPDTHVPGWLLVDVLQDVDVVVQNISHPVLFICDDGNKPLEMKTYASHLIPGDLMAVHDWGTEVDEDDVPDSLTMVHEEWCKSMTRFFEVTA